MKGFGIVLLCAFVAAQARSTSVQSASRAALGENPWVVHLKYATSQSGLLESCVGVLYNESWVLTAASCVDDVRFMWIFYGAVNVIHPELVTETSRVHLHPHHDIALISINRIVQTTNNIRPGSFAAADDELPASGKLCRYAGIENVPGEQLVCVELDLEASETGAIVADGESTKFDLGAPIVSDDTVYGILVRAGETSEFLATASYQDWIDEEIAASARTSLHHIIDDA